MDNSTNRDDDDDLDRYFETEVRGKTRSNDVEVQLSDNALLAEIRVLGQQDKIPMKTDIFAHYDNLRGKNLISEELYDMIMVALSAPATQVSVERAFSAL